MFRLRPAVVVIAALLCQAGQSAERRPITVSEASELVRALLKPDGWTKLPRFVLYQALFDAAFKDFYFIHAESGKPPVAIGHYAVERSTGEVWDWVRCGEFNSPALREEQEALRKRIGLSAAEYQKIRKPGPFCEPGEAPQALTMGRPKPK